MNKEEFKRKLTAVLSADVKGYSLLMADNESETVSTLISYREGITNLILEYNGRVIDSPGDNILAEFGSVVKAVECGLEVQKNLNAWNAEKPLHRRMEFRMGVNLGDVIEEGERIYGDVVNGNHTVPSRGLQIEGTAILRGHPLDEANTEMREAYEKHQPKAYERSVKRHFSLPNYVVIVTIPTRVALFVAGSTAAESHLDAADIKKSKRIGSYTTLVIISIPLYTRNRCKHSVFDRNSSGNHDRPGSINNRGDMAIFGQMFLNRGSYGETRVLSQPSVSEMTRNHIPGIDAYVYEMFIPEASWGYGWGIQGNGKWRNFTGSLSSPLSFGHSGNGGVVLWIDPT